MSNVRGTKCFSLVHSYQEKLEISKFDQYEKSNSADGPALITMHKYINQLKIKKEGINYYVNSKAY
jgi:hypothetical protein